ncbi:MAG: 2-amino-4-hydroxy-6-hydroxymethyldihydropteridine diphosphokinase [Lachnospiraceae bacterium]|nr:2-amino-4-hydroxy-6-hydroxymethyldihydropteridine diphosphokinase [Lachnospiraceae bacterium]
MDTIEIKQLKVFAYHGVLDQEKEQGQEFYINVKLFLDLERAGLFDQLPMTVDYSTVCDMVVSHAKNNRYDLLEALAEQTIVEVLNAFPLLSGMEMEIFKPQAPIAHSFENVSVKIRRMWHTVYIGLGSNMGNRKQYIQSGIDALEDNHYCRVINVSEMIETKPYGYLEQDDFINGVVKIETLLSPQILLDLLHKIEDDQGRERLIHWGPRTLDMDILFFDRKIIDTPTLHIPHIDMPNREFVLAPLCELAPYLRHPLNGLTVSQMLEKYRQG